MLILTFKNLVFENYVLVILGISRIYIFAINFTLFVVLLSMGSKSFLYEISKIFL